MIYLDNSSTTRQYDEVTRYMAEVAGNSFGNPSSLHGLGLEAEKLMKEGRRKIALGFNASPDEVYITSCGTESDNTVLMGIARVPRPRAKKIITTAVEHPAVLEPAAEMERRGFEVVRLGVDSHGMIDLDELKEALSADTLLISVMAVNNEVGSIMPLKEIGEIKRAFNKANGTRVLLHTDAVQALGKISLDTRKELKDVDLISASAHKIHGPKGIGSLYVRKGTNLMPFMLGGGQEKGFRSGTENVPSVSGFGLACEMAVNNLDSRVAHMREVRDYLKKGIMDSISDIRINSPEDGVCSVLNVSFIGTRGEVILHKLEDDGIYVSTGSACSSNHKTSKGSHVLNAMGLKPKEIEGALRFSFSEFNTIEEMDFVLDRLKTSVEGFRRLGSFR
ncbi:MAG: cysteine desulfurase [Firmicutes bacterium]|nr:cysteine desulfurase [Bacillota bacterium]